MASNELASRAGALTRDIGTTPGQREWAAVAIQRVALSLADEIQLHQMLDLIPSPPAPRYRKPSVLAALKSPAASPEEPKQRRRVPAECGTASGYTRHRRDGERACQACKDAENAYQRKKYAEKHPGKPPTKPCGTSAAYQQHLKRGEQPCEACAKAAHVDQHRWRAQREGLLFIEPEDLVA